MNSDVEEIKSRLNIVDVLGEYIRLEKAGVNYKARCPFHNEKSPSFMVNEEKQIWHCFGCQKGGDIFGFVMEMEGLEFKETLKLLADKAGVELHKFSGQSGEKKSRTLEILELATKFYEIQLWQGAGKVKILNYLRERGLNDETIKEFRLGYAPTGWRNLLEFLTKRNYSLPEIEKTGLLVKKADGNDFYDRFRDRIIFPVADAMGKVVGYSARVAPGGDESQAKYVNTPESEVYHKSKVLYGLDKAKSEIKRQDYVLLVEGNMDVIAASQAGIKNTVAVSGTALTQDQLTIIKRYTDNLKMFFDMDNAGQAATKKSIKVCFGREMNVKVVALPEGKDAADMAKSNVEGLREAIKNSPAAMEYFFQKVFSKFDKDKVDEQKLIAAELLEMIASMASEIEKSHWIKKLAQELGLRENILTDLLKKATLKDRISKPSENSEAAVTKKTPETKLDILVHNLAGLMLVYASVWQKVAELDEKSRQLFGQGLVGQLLSKGAAVEFDFDKLLPTVDSLEEKEAIEKIFFETKYRLGINNEIEEVILNNPVGEFEKCVQEIRKENCRMELEKIEHDLKAAEDAGDKEAQNFLKQEVKRISLEFLT